MKFVIESNQLKQFVRRISFDETKYKKKNQINRNEIKKNKKGC